MRTKIAASCVVGLTLSISIEHSFANPVGGSVVGGDANATISGQGTALTTINQSANQVIINWQDFSIGAGEITRFVQPSDTAAALNRVTSGNPSEIYGSLQANGRVFVINPNGILVGPSGQIDTKGFVASTLDVPDASFLSGANLILSGNSSAGVRNEGSIQALGGDVYLIAHNVENDGTINAPQGTVGLAAGSQVQLVQSGDERLSVLAGNSSGPATAVGVNNSGTIQAASAELKAAGGNIYALAINNGGVVRATGIVNKGGHIYLAATGGNIQNSGTLAANNADGSGGTIMVDGGHNATAPSTVINSGTITAKGSTSSGGQVELLGDQVAVGDGGVVDVSGDTGGGTVLIGGDLHGANSSVQNAQATFISPNAQINADALTLGNGGKVVVWSDDATRFYGNISARGGASGGNGGFVEVSGNQDLVFQGNVDAAAPDGIAGQLLLDPSFLYIVNGAAGTGDQDGNLPITFAAPNTALNTLSVGELQSLGDVNITLQAKDTITIGDSSSAPADLDLSGTLVTKTLTLSAGNNTAGTATAGDVVFNTGSSIETGGGNVTINAGQGSDAGASVTLGAVSTGGGALNVTALNGVSFNGAVSAGTMTLNNGAAVTGNGLITATTLTLNGNGDVGTSVARLQTAVTTLKDNKSGGDTYVNQAGALNLDGTTTGTGLLDVLGSVGITIDAALNIHNGAAAGDTLALSGTTMAINNPVRARAVTLSNGGAVTGSGLITAATTLTLTGNGAVGTSGARLQTAVATLTDDKSGGDAYVNQTGALNLDGTTTGAGLLDVVGNAGITVDAALNIDSGLAAGDMLMLKGAAMTINNPVTANAVTLNNSGTATGSGLITATTLTLDGNGGVGSGGPPLNTAVAALVLGKGGGNTSIAEADDVTLDGSSSGNVTLAAGGNITIDAAYTANGGTLTANGGNGTLTLTGTGNVGSGGTPIHTDVATLVDSQSAGGAANLIEADDVTLDGLSSGNLTLATGGNITIDAAFSAAGGMLTANGGNGTLTLTGAGNVGSSGTPINTTVATLVMNKGSGDGFIKEFDDVTLDGSSGGGLTLGAGGNITIDAAYSAAGGTLTANSGNGTLRLTGTGDVGASGTPINTDVATLVDNKGAGTAYLNENDGLNLQGSMAGSSLDLADGGTTVINAALTAGALDTVTLDGAVSRSGGGTLTVGTLALTGSGNVGSSGTRLNTSVDTLVLNKAAGDTFINEADTLQLQGTTAGNLDVLAHGTIGQSGALVVNGAGATATFNAGAGNDITLGNLNNDFHTVAIAGGQNVTLVDVNAIDLGASTVPGTLSVTAGGDITESGALSVNSSSSTFTYSGSTLGNVLLGNEANDFGGQTVTINASGIGAIQDVAFRNVSSSASFSQFSPLPAGLRNLTVQFDAAPIVVPTLTLSGTLDLNSGAQVTQTGPIGANALQVTAVGPVSLDNPMNQVGTVAGSVSGSGNAFSFTDLNALTVGTVDATSGIRTHNGNITLKADAMEIANPLNSGTANTTLEPYSAGWNINLGSEVAGYLSLKQSELNEVTANILQIGSLTTGNIFGEGSVVRPLTVNTIQFVGSGGTIQISSDQLAGLSQVEIPVPRLETTTFSTASISLDQAAKILPPGAIGTLWLQIPFPPAKEENYRIEDISKWTSGPLAAMGSTSGPQVPK